MGRASASCSDISGYLEGEREEKDDRPRARDSAPLPPLSSSLTFVPSSLFAVTWTYQSLLELIRRKGRAESDQAIEISFEWKQGNLHRDLENGELAFPSSLLHLSSFFPSTLDSDFFSRCFSRGGRGSLRSTWSRLGSGGRHPRFLLPASVHSHPPATTTRLSSSESP